MKKLILALMLVSSGAFAQAGPEVYRVASPSQVQGFNTTTSTTVTSAIFHRIMRATCNADCFIWINASGQSFPVNKITGVFLPEDVPTNFLISSQSSVRVIGATASGNIYIQELTK